MAAAGMGAGLIAALLASFDLRWLFVADAATCLACAVVVAAFLPSSQRKQVTEESKVNAWTDPRLLAMLVFGTVFAIIYLQITIALPLTLTDRGLSISLLGVILTVAATTMVLGQPVLACRRVRLLDDFTAMTIGYTILAAGLLLNEVATDLAGFVVAAIVWSVGDLVLLGRAYTIIAAIASETGRGRYMAVYGISWGLAGIAAPLLGTQLLAHGGPLLAWSAVAALCLALAVAQPVLRRRFRPREASAELGTERREA